MNENMWLFCLGVLKILKLKISLITQVRKNGLRKLL